MNPSVVFQSEKYVSFRSCNRMNINDYSYELLHKWNVQRVLHRIPWLRPDSRMKREYKNPKEWRKQFKRNVSIALWQYLAFGIRCSAFGMRMLNVFKYLKCDNINDSSIQRTMAVEWYEFLVWLSISMRCGLHLANVKICLFRIRLLIREYRADIEHKQQLEKKLSRFEFAFEILEYE